MRYQTAGGVDKIIVLHRAVSKAAYTAKCPTDRGKLPLAAKLRMLFCHRDNDNSSLQARSLHTIIILSAAEPSKVITLPLCMTLKTEVPQKRTCHISVWAT